MSSTWDKWQFEAGDPCEYVTDGNEWVAAHVMDVFASGFVVTYYDENNTPTAVYAEASELRRVQTEESLRDDFIALLASASDGRDFDVRTVIGQAYDAGFARGSKK